MTAGPSRPADPVWLIHLSCSAPDSGTVARVHAAPAPRTSALTVVVAADDVQVALVPAEQLPSGSTAAVGRQHVDQIVELLRLHLTDAAGPVLLAAADPMAQLAAWRLLQVSDDVIATNSLDSAIRVAQLLERGVAPDRVLHPPPFDITRSVADAGIGPAASAVSTVTVTDTTPPDGEHWLTLGNLSGPGPDDSSRLEVHTGAMSRRSARTAGSLAGVRRRVPATADRRLVVGPANSAGQGYEWARSVREHAPGWTARNFQVVSASSRMSFRADLPLTKDQWKRPATRISLALELLADATDILVEAMRPLLAVGDASDVADGWDPRRGREDVEALRATGRRVALLFHGSEVRRPAHHLRLTPWSPFYRKENSELTTQLEQVTEQVQDAFADFDGPILVSTPDLVDHVPNAVWLPGVVGAASFNAARPALTGPRPIVAHAPSNSALKGSEWIDPVLHDLDRRGLIHYRRLQDLPSIMIPSVLAEVDVLVDQVVMGNPGVLAAQAMAAGRLVVAHLPEGVRRRISPRSPIVEATPATLEDTILSVVESPEHYGRLAASGTEFARIHHDGRRSASVLTTAFGEPAGACGV